MERHRILLWLFLSAGCALIGCRERPAPQAPRQAAPISTRPLAGKTQLVTVVSEDWNGFSAVLRRYERRAHAGGAPMGAWSPVAKPVRVVLGREGYGWGRGLHGDGSPGGRPGPIKREGDGRSPAGAFGIGPVYGYAEARASVALPYRHASADLRCVDDPSSRHYNRIVSALDTDVDWKSAEHMRRDDDLYVLTVVVEHNTASPRPQAGSCIFLHLWRGPGEGMSGCTAMPLDVLEAMVDWFGPGTAALVALPHSEYDALEDAWGLPPL